MPEPGGDLPPFNVSQDTFPPERVGPGLLAIAATAHGAPMVVAVQVGRGTGKVPVYGRDEVPSRWPASAAGPTHCRYAAGRPRNGWMPRSWRPARP
ncbi:hypothetical protein GCM10020216_057330 [Nonomuraea helvata]